MPTVLRVGGYRFFFYSRETNEPPHIHVQSGEKTAKFWLGPVVLARSEGYNSRVLRELQNIVEQHEQLFQEAWNDYFSR